MNWCTKWGTVCSVDEDHTTWIDLFLNDRNFYGPNGDVHKDSINLPNLHMNGTRLQTFLSNIQIQETSLLVMTPKPNFCLNIKEMRMRMKHCMHHLSLTTPLTHPGKFLVPFFFFYKKSRLTSRWNFFQGHTWNPTLASLYCWEGKW